MDPNTGAHTQNIENLWWQIKRQLPETYSRHDQLYLHLSEYMWRQLRKDSHDLYVAFLKDVAKYYNGNIRSSALKCMFFIQARKAALHHVITDSCFYFVALLGRSISIVSSSD